MNKTFHSGKTVSQGYYKAFIPNEINREWTIDDMNVVKLLSQADRQLGRLEMYSEYVNIDLYIAMHIAKEATQSSRIEGTQTHVEEVFLDKKDVTLERRDDWDEVQNYIIAMNEAVNQLHRLPFSGRLIRQAHKILLSGVRGEHKAPGEYRTSQNWIGGASINDAVFIPPPPQEIEHLMSDIDKLANDQTNPMPDLIRAAIIHYQFETIHPFLDGNGRVGRLLITLYLVSQGILKRPILYLSDFFERNKSLYYDNLMRARTHNDINQWLKFFLTGVIETSIKGVSTFDGIMQIQRSLDDRLKPLAGRVGGARLVIDELYKNPITNASKVETIIGKSSVSAYKMIADLEKLEILQEITGGQRSRSYAFKEYLDLFK